MKKIFKFAIFFLCLNLLFADTAPNSQKAINLINSEQNLSNLDKSISEFNLTNYKIPLPFDMNLSTNSQNLEKNQNILNEQNVPNLEPFNGMNFSMPSDAAILNEIIIRYTDGTGVVQEKILEINKTINWQNDFSVISREKPHFSKTLDVSVTSKDPNLKEKAQSTVGVLVTPKFELPIETLKFDDELKFIVREKNIRLVTADPIKAQSSRGGVLKAEFFRMEIPLSFVSFYLNKGGFADINITRNDGFYAVEISAKEGNLILEKIEGGYEVFIR